MVLIDPVPVHCFSTTNALFCLLYSIYIRFGAYDSDSWLPFLLIDDIEVIGAFMSTSRYLDDIMNIENSCRMGKSNLST